MSNQITWKPKEIKLDQSINTSTADNDIKPIEPEEGPSPHLANNGIFKDGGITNIYKNTGGSVSTSKVRWLGNNKKVNSSLLGSFPASTSGITIDDISTTINVSALRKTGNLTFDNLYDLILLANGNFLGLRYPITGGQSLIYEYNSAGIRINSYVFTLSTSTPVLSIAFVRKKGMQKVLSGSSIQNHIVVIFNTGEALYFILNGSSSPTSFLIDTVTLTDINVINGSVNSAWCYGTANYFCFGWGNAELETLCTYGPTTGVGLTKTQEAVYAWQNAELSSASSYNADYTIRASGTTAFKSIAITSGSVAFTNFVHANPITSNYGVAPNFIRGVHDNGGAGNVQNHFSLANSSTTTLITTEALIPDNYSAIDQQNDFMTVFYLATNLAIALHSVNQQAGYFSFYFNSVVPDAGVPLNVVGSIDQNYIFQYMNFTTYGLLLHKTNTGSFVVHKIEASNDFNYQEIAPNVYKFDTLSEYNVLDLNTNTLKVGSSAWNAPGVYICSNDTTGSATLQSVPVASYREGQFISYPDRGDLIIDIYDTPGKTRNVSLSSFNNTNSPKGVSFFNYVSDEIRNFQTDNIYSLGIVFNNQDSDVPPLYIPRTDIPVPAGGVIEAGGVNLYGSSAIQYPNKPSYTIENQMSQDFQFFQLYGQIYGFDGYRIWLIPGSYGGTIGIPYPIAVANGLRYLCTSAVAVWFVSDFDNSLWSFDGGRSVTKQVDLSQEETIRAGAWSVKDNELILRTDTGIIFARDGILTKNTNPFGGSTSYNIDVVSGETSSIGFYLTHDNLWYTLTYKANGSTVGLNWQSAYFGPSNNQLFSCNKVAIYLKLPSGSPLVQTLTLTHKWFTESTSGTTTATLATITPNADGYARLWWVPTQARALGHSLGLSTADAGAKIVVLEVVPYWLNAEDALIQSINNFS